jgi:hypothetical protein
MEMWQEVEDSTIIGKQFMTRYFRIQTSRMRKLTIYSLIRIFFSITHRKPNRQQSDGFQFGGVGGQFGGVGGQFGGAGALPYGGNVGIGGPALFPGQGINGLGHGGYPNYNNFNPALQGHGIQGYPQGIGGGGFNNLGHQPQGLRNGILVGPGGPTGIIGRPYGIGNGYNGAGGIFPGAGLGQFGGQGFDGGFNNPAAFGGPGGIGGIGGIFPQGGGGGNFHDSSNTNSPKNYQNFKRVEKSIE